MAALAKNDLEAIVDMRTAGEDLGMLFTMACKRGAVDAARLMLKGLDPEVPTRTGILLLKDGVDSGGNLFELFSLLVDEAKMDVLKDFDMTSGNETFKMTHMRLATHYGFLPLMELLASRGAMAPTDNNAKAQNELIMGAIQEDNMPQLIFWLKRGYKFSSETIMHLCQKAPSGNDPAYIIKLLHDGKPEGFDKLVATLTNPNHAHHFNPRRVDIIKSFLRSGSCFCCAVCESVRNDGRTLKFCACRTIAYCE